MASRKSVSALVLTHSADFFTVDQVMQALVGLGQRPLRLDTDQLGHSRSLEVELSPKGARVTLDGEDLSGVKAIWARRLWAPSMPDGFDALSAHAASQAWMTQLVGGLELLGAHWVNDWSKQLAAENKLKQLALARRVGFTVPATLSTASGDSAVRFRSRHGATITKLLEPVVQSMGAHPRFVYTQALHAPDAAIRESLRWAPQLFQPEVEKAREVRLVCAGEKQFAASIETHVLDWRQLTHADGAVWQVEKTPAAIASKAKKLLRSLGLVYGALDFIVTSKGEWVFLEVNPAGEYGWLEHELGLEISKAIAVAMIEGAR